jgi:hypothetical protein
LNEYIVRACRPDSVKHIRFVHGASTHEHKAQVVADATDRSSDVIVVIQTTVIAAGVDVACFDVLLSLVQVALIFIEFRMVLRLTL